MFLVTYFCNPKFKIFLISINNQYHLVIYWNDICLKYLLNFYCLAQFKGSFTIFFGAATQVRIFSIFPMFF